MAKKKRKKNRDGFLRRVQYAIEYAFVRALSGLVGMMPERLAVFAGQALGTIYWLVGFYRRRIARKNIEKAMPGERTRQEVSRLVREVFIHIGLSTVETLWMRTHVTRENIEERFPVEGVEPAKQALTGGRGGIAFTPHLGNWELFGGCMAAHLGRFNALARPVNNPLVRAYTTRLRENLGMRVLSTRDGVRPMIKALKNGEGLAILIDQHVSRAFASVTFFSREAATTAVVASLALRMDLPIFMAYSVRDGHSFRHHGYLVGPLDLVRTGDHDADVHANTQMFNDELEKIVRQHPGQWLWTHRRWKLAERKARRRKKQRQAAPATEECSPNVREAC